MVASVSFAAASVLMTLVNKAALGPFGFEGPLTLTAAQSLATLAALGVWSAASSAGLLPGSVRVRLPEPSLRTAASMAPLAALFVAKLASSMLSLGRTNVPMFTVLRQTAVLFVVLEEWLWFGSAPPLRVWGAVAMICGGAGLAAFRDNSADGVGYAYLAAANLASSLYAVAIPATQRATGLDVAGMLAYNTALTLPALAMLAAATGDLDRAASFSGWADARFVSVFAAATVLSFVLNLALFYCTTLTSATTKTVISGMKSGATVIAGALLFADYRYNHTNAVGIAISFAGGLWYTAESLRGQGISDGSSAHLATASLLPDGIDAGGAVALEVVDKDKPASAATAANAAVAEQLLAPTPPPPPPPARLTPQPAARGVVQRVVAAADVSATADLQKFLPRESRAPTLLARRHVAVD